MDVEMRFFANFREIVGQKTVHREYDDVSTVGEILHALHEEYPDMELFEDDGSLREYLTIMKDGKDIAHIDGLETELEGDTTISVFPPVAGG